MDSSPIALTRILQAWSEGNQSALEQLTPIVYAELHKIAQRNLAGQRGDHVLQPSALVNEAFLRLMGNTPVEWANRAHFFGFSARLMRHILIDFARGQQCAKRGGQNPRVRLSVAGDVAASEPDLLNLLALNQALDELAEMDARQARTVELKYFGGMENAEIAAALGVSEPTVIRDWRVARAWLYGRLQSLQTDAPIA